jgi:hypothetical protein
MKNEERVFMSVASWIFLFQIMIKAVMSNNYYSNNEA